MDYYTTLGIERNANQEEIKQAYRKLAAKHHPDRGGDTATFQKIQEAYDTLSDSNKKQQYDNPDPFNNMNGGGFNFNGFPGGFGFQANGVDINDLFSQMFGNQNPFHHRQQVFRTHIDITLEDSYNGGNKVLKIQTNTGNKVINIEIPKGIKHADNIRYDNVLDGAQLIIEFRIQNHLRFERKGHDLCTNQQISVLDLIVGSKIDFKTISGKTFQVEINPMTQPYMQLKISGQGMPIPNSNMFGDQIILIKPFIPDTIDSSITESILRSRRN
jgi:curved DNA-binding protein